MKKKSEVAPPSRHDRRKALEAVAGKFDSFRPARQVLTNVKAVPTIFAQLDHAVRIGGWPLERISLIHGRSNEGKTAFVLGLIKSFLMSDHIAALIDAERTTPDDWVVKLLGPLADHPGFFAMKPETYEQTMADVRNFLNKTIEFRKTGKIPKDTAVLVVVDSIRKLNPKNQMAEILKANAKESGIKGGNDRSGQLKAKMNAAWMDELTPLAELANASIVLIGREMADPDADMFAKLAGRDYKVGGGQGLVFDSALVVRIDRAAWLQGPKPSPVPPGYRPPIFGERHRGTVRKTKVAGKDTKETVFYFHSSNGTIAPEGFDTVRDVLELAIRFGVVDQNGSSFSFNGERFGQGAENAVKVLRDSPEFFETIERLVRQSFAHHNPLEFDVDDDGVVTEK